MTEDLQYHISTHFNSAYPEGQYRITRGPWSKVVWSRPATKEDLECDGYPQDLREVYEAFVGRPEFVETDEILEPELVELMDDGHGSGFNQKCAYGYLVEGHSVYCHNAGWLYAPRKCRRSWYTGDEVKDEDCRGFKPRVSGAA